MGRNAIRVIIADADNTIRQLLSRVLDAHPRMQVLAVYANPAEARASLAKPRPAGGGVDILVLDLEFAASQVEELLAEAGRAGLKTVIYSKRDDESSVLGAIERGADGYVLKQADSGNLLHALLQLAEGGAPISPALTAHLIKRFRREPTVAPVAADGTSLTGREQEVLTYIAKGLSYGEISGLLEMSRHTVTSHVRHIYRKLSVGSRGEAVYEAMQMGLLRMAS